MLTNHCSVDSSVSDQGIDRLFQAMPEEVFQPSHSPAQIPVQKIYPNIPTYRIRIGAGVTLSSKKRNSQELTNLFNSLSYSELDEEHIVFIQAFKP